MSMTDPIADLLTRIRNANLARLEKVKCPSSKIKVKILEILQQEGFIKNFKVAPNDGKPELQITLKYLENRIPVIVGLKRVSRPGLRQYVRHDSIPRVQNGMGTAILSTSQGVMSDREARKRGIGGELICSIW
ncbi:MAG: 30S ribosomal protein S8 [Myxococcales bacterium]|nr:MAG: 30S ribosomal protein S8 [Myxococcales bacterium]